jgi:adenylate cyclase
VLAVDLGVRYLLEGGIQRVGDRVRIKVRLVEAATDTPVWAESYDREFKDIFAIQDDVTRRVVGTLVSQIGQVEIERTLRKPPDSLEAYAITVQGRRLWRKSRKKSIPEARSLLLQAVEKYPNYAPAYVYLAFTYLTAYNNAWSEEFESPTNMPKMAELARQAILIDDSYGLAHATRAVALTYLGKHEQGLASAERALALNPSDSDVLGRVGQVFNFYGDNERAIEVLKKAMELDPYSPAQWRNFISRAYFFSKQYRDAALAATACIERAPIEPCHVTRIASFGQLEEMKSAHEVIADYKKVNPGAGVETSVARLRRVFRRPYDIPHLEEGLRKAGLPE